MKLRRLNQLGLEKMGSYLDSLTSDNPQSYPSSIPVKDTTSEDLIPQIEIDPDIRFPRRFEAAKYLFACLAPLRTSKFRSLEQDRGLWAWLSLLWFQQLCPKDRDGRLRPRERARWIPVLESSRRFYRHLLLGPYVIYRMHSSNPELVEPVLSNKLEVATGEVFRTIVETPQFLSSAPVLALFGRLYYDSNKKRMIRGAGTKGSGGARRLGDLLSQLDRTFDLHTIKADDLLGLLPNEFRSERRAT